MARLATLAADSDSCWLRVHTTYGTRSVSRPRDRGGSGDGSVSQRLRSEFGSRWALNVGGVGARAQWRQSSEQARAGRAASTGPGRDPIRGGRRDGMQLLYQAAVGNLRHKSLTLPPPHHERTPARRAAPHRRQPRHPLRQARQGVHTAPQLGLGRRRRRARWRDVHSRYPRRALAPGLAAKLANKAGRAQPPRARPAQARRALVRPAQGVPDRALAAHILAALHARPRQLLRRLAQMGQVPDAQLRLVSDVQKRHVPRRRHAAGQVDAPRVQAELETNADEDAQQARRLAAAGLLVAPRVPAGLGLPNAQGNPRGALEGRERRLRIALQGRDARDLQELRRPQGSRQGQDLGQDARPRRLG